jgi:Cu/Ag efflux protein CusF
VRFAVLSLIFFSLTACSSSRPKASVRQYQLTGKVVSVDVKQHTAAIDGAAIPNFMGAMKMDYPIASDADLAALKAGEEISATVNMNDDGSYNLSNIHERPAAGAGK